MSKGAKPEVPNQPVLVFDGECGLCQRSVRWLLSRTGLSVEMVPYQLLGERLPQVDRLACAQAVQFVGADGRVVGGAAAVAEALAQVPGHGLLRFCYRWLPGAGRLAERVYAAVAVNRGPLAGAFARVAGRDPEPPSFTGSRRLFFLWLGVVVMLAFGSLGVQFDLLFGESGIWSVADTMDAAQNAMVGFWRQPTLLWWLPASAAPFLCWLGMGSGLLLVLGRLPRSALVVALACWLSLMQVGHEFVIHAGDYLLLETMLLALLLAPRRELRPRWRVAPLPVTRWLLVLLCLRVCVATAWLRVTGPVPTGDVLRLELITQPLPSTFGLWCAGLPSLLMAPLSYAVVLGELLLPWLLFGPRRLRHAAAALLVVIQAGWLATGTQGVAPLLVIGLLLLAVDDLRWLPVLPGRWHPGMAGGVPEARSFRTWVSGGLAALLLAGLVVQGFGDGRPDALAQQLDRFGIGHGYSDFGFVAAERGQLIVQASQNGQSWFDYVTRYAPADVSRAPAYAVGHLPRLDWQLQFAAAPAANGQVLPWLEWLALRLLQQKGGVAAAFAVTPFEGAVPQAVRFLLCRYELAPAVDQRVGAWWRRQQLRPVGKPFRLGG